MSKVPPGAFDGNVLGLNPAFRSRSPKGCKQDSRGARHGQHIRDLREDNRTEKKSGKKTKQNATELAITAHRKVGKKGGLSPAASASGSASVIALRPPFERDTRRGGSEGERYFQYVQKARKQSQALCRHRPHFKRSSTTTPYLPPKASLARGERVSRTYRTSRFGGSWSSSSWRGLPLRRCCPPLGTA